MNIYKNIRTFSIISLCAKSKLLPLCIDCKFFIKPKPDYPAESFGNDKYGKCRKFGKIHLVTGEIEYKFAEFNREYQLNI